MLKIKVGLVRTNDRTGLAPDPLPPLQDLSSRLPFQLIDYPDPVSDPQAAKEAAAVFAEQGVDLVLLLCQGFTIHGELVIPLVEFGARLAIWAIPEPKNEGPLPLNSMTAFNLFTSVLGNTLRDRHIKFKWLYGNADSPVFQDRFEVTVRAIAALKAVQDAHIAVVGGVAMGFVNLNYDKADVEAKLGVHVDEIDLQGVFKQAKTYPQEQVQELVAEIEGRASSSSVTDEMMDTSARTILALQDTLDKESYDALAVSCWPAFQEDMGIFPCMAYGWLNDTGTIVSCEGDMLGAVAMLALSRAAADKAMLMDMVALNEDENAIMWWHCGVGLPSYADDAGYGLMTYPSYTPPGAEPRPMPGVAVDLKFRPQPATVLRLTDDGQQALIISADIVQGPDRGFTGVRGWFTNLTIGSEPATPLEVLDAVVRHGIEHHYAIVRGDVSEAMIEFAHWMGIEVIRKKPYTNYL